MIKFNPFIIPAVIISLFTGFINEYIIMFFILFFHETGHLMAIKRNSIEISSIAVHPFGISITLKNEFFDNPADEIPVALAGPIISIASGLLAYMTSDLLFPDNRLCNYFSFSSIFLGVFNLIPAYPCDGGRILKAYLSTRYGYIKSYNSVIKLTRIISLLLIITGIYIIFKCRFNFTFCLTGCFLYYGILTEKNHSLKYLKKELEKYKTKNLGKKLPVKRIATDGEIPATRLIEDLSPGYYCIFEIIDGFRKKKEFTEGELMDAVLNNGTDIFIKDIYISTK